MYLHTSNAKLLGEVLARLTFHMPSKLPSVSQCNESPNSGIMWLSYKSFLPAYCDPACRGLSYYWVQSYSAQGLSFKTGWRIHLGKNSIWYPTFTQGESLWGGSTKIRIAATAQLVVAAKWQNDFIIPAFLYWNMLFCWICPPSIEPMQKCLCLHLHCT